MKKRFCFLLGIAPLLPITCSLLVTTSCSNVQKYFDYIQQRTFSLAAKTSDGTETWHCGTAWIFDHASTSNHYEYYVATCMHVQFGFEQYMGGTYDIYYEFGDNNQTTYGTYQKLNISDYQWIGKSTTQTDFNSWQRLSTFERGTASVNLVTDISVLKIDFTNYLQNDAELKGRLDNLNKLDHIVEFAPNITSTKDILDERLYIGGYATNTDPVTKNSIYTKWSTKSDKVVDYQVFNGSYNSHGHSVDVGFDDDDLDNSLFYSNAMEWQLPSSQNVGHGASGAMAINSRYQVVGLFWGGYKDNTIDPDVHGYPSVEILNAHSPFTYGINSYNVMDNFYESLDVGSN